ncbi:MAG: CAAX prenyl protease-related protein [Verrucomicrobiota bacterium]
MNLLREQLVKSPIHARVVPYALILIVTSFFQDSFGEAGRYWIYFFKILLALACIREMRDLVPEMRWAFSLEAVAVGIAIAALWVGLDPYYPKMQMLFKMGEPWDPFKAFGEHSGKAWFFFWVRTLGSAIAIPPIEEVFYRSFLYRYGVRTDFQSMPLNQFHPTSFIVISLLFGFVHFQWIPGVMCGMAYQWLVLRKNRLGDAMLAHAITNFLLGLWILWKGQWQFW